MFSSSFHDEAYAIAVLNSLRHESSASALSLLEDYSSQGISGTLLDELYLRLTGQPSPHIVTLRQWLSNRLLHVFGIKYYAYTLPNLFSDTSRLTLIDRGFHLPFNHTFSLFKADIPSLGDLAQVEATSTENSRIVSDLAADCFISTTISTASSVSRCSQIALVHDCMPEHFSPSDQRLLPLRHHWLSSSSHFLCVSQNTLNDLIRFYDVPQGSSYWCHPAPFLHDFGIRIIISIVEFVRSLDSPFFFCHPLVL